MVDCTPNSNPPVSWWPPNQLWEYRLSPPWKGSLCTCQIEGTVTQAGPAICSHAEMLASGYMKRALIEYPSPPRDAEMPFAKVWKGKCYINVSQEMVGSGDGTQTQNGFHTTKARRQADVRTSFSTGETDERSRAVLLIKMLHNYVLQSTILSAQFCYNHI